MEEEPRIEFGFRDDARADIVEEQFRSLPPNARTEFFHLLETIAASGLDDDAERVTLAGRYEASARRLPNAKAWVAFVCDLRAAAPKPGTVLLIAGDRPSRDMLFKEARAALRLVDPTREDH